MEMEMEKSQSLNFYYAHDFLRSNYLFFLTFLRGIFVPSLEVNVKFFFLFPFFFSFFVQVRRILTGLGFTVAMQDGTSTTLSGE